MADPRWYFDFVSPFSYLQWRKLRTLIDQHLSRQFDHSTALWMLIMFDAFLRVSHQSA